MLSAYRQLAAERDAQGIPPLPLTAEQTQALTLVLQNPPAGDSSELLYLLRERIPPGVDEAAYVKATWLSAIAQGNSKSPLITPLEATKLLGTMIGGYNVAALIELLPGEVQQSLHRDGGIYPVRHPAPPLTLAAFWAYTDFTEENGATLVAPGSHLWAHEREPLAHELVQAVMPRGSVLLYTSSVWHGSASNRSDSPRTGMALHYNLGWLRQEEALLLSTPPDLAKDYPEQLQRLIGYDFGGPYLGFIEQGNPHRLLEDPPKLDYARTDPDLEARRKAIEPIPIGRISKSS